MREVATPGRTMYDQKRADSDMPGIEEGGVPGAEGYSVPLRAGSVPRAYFIPPTRTAGCYLPDVEVNFVPEPAAPGSAHRFPGLPGHRIDRGLEVQVERETEPVS